MTNTNIIHTWLWIEQSIELYLKHYKFGKNYEDSTILVDSDFNIIWYFNHKTNNVDIIQAEIPFKGDFIIKNWKKVKTNKIINYKDDLDYLSNI